MQDVCIGTTKALLMHMFGTALARGCTCDYHYVVTPSLRTDLVVLSKSSYHEVIIFLPGTFLTVFLRDLQRLEGGS